MLEIILTIMLAFGVGAYVGKEGQKAAEQKPNQLPAKQPDVWPPVDHKDLLRTCSVACGEGKFKSYNSVYGKCNCKGK